jgi:hypothetical protein
VDSHPYRTIGIGCVAVTAAAVYWLTAYPTITWWDSSQYSLAASTLGVTGAPGSLLLTLLGWAVTRLPIGSHAHTLNLLAGVLAALAAALVCLAATRVHDMIARADETATQAKHGAIAVGAALGALTVACGDTLWEHAIKFTPYVLSAVFTGLIVCAMLRWWEEADRPHAWRRLTWLALLFGIDFSVHRTNALLLPAVLVWILLRRARTLREGKVWLGGAGGLLAGLAVQLLIIPIAASTDSILNMGDASNLTRFWDYVSLRMLGGGFLVDFFPRKAPLWSTQAADFVRVMGANFFRWDGPLGLLGILPALAGIAGLAELLRRNRRLGTAFALVLLIQATMTVLYFNIPAEFFRPFDRHYLPVCLTFGIAVAYGSGVFLAHLARIAARRPLLAAALGALLLVLMPASQLTANWADRNASRRYFTRDFAVNMLQGLPPDAVLLTAGDNDTFPLWYVQTVEGVRPDVQIVNRPLTNTVWYVEQILRRDPSFPVSLSREERLALTPRPWPDTMVVSVEGAVEQPGVTASTPIPQTMILRAAPGPSNFMLPADQVMLDVLRTNRWRRPLCVAITVPDEGIGWFHDYARLDGLFWRIMPIADPAVDPAVLRTNLLETYTYEGYADPAVRLDPVSRNMGTLYVRPFTMLMNAEKQGGSVAACHEVAVEYLNALPPTRLGRDMLPAAEAEALCGGEP